MDGIDGKPSFNMTEHIISVLPETGRARARVQVVKLPVFTNNPGQELLSPASPRASAPRKE
jgi:hypothetical protein